MTEYLEDILNELKNINSSLSNNYEWIPTLISTLAGVFAGVYLTYFYQVKGSLKIYANNVSFNFEKSFDQIGFDIRNVKIDEEPEKGQVMIDIDILNTKLVSENMRQINLTIEKSKKEKKELVLYDKATFRQLDNRVKYDEFKISNVPPKSVISYQLKALLNREIIDLLLKNPKVYMTFRNQKNKLKKQLIQKIEIDKLNN